MGELLEPLFQKLVLLFLEDVRNVKLLKLFVGKIDEKLFKRINFKHFKAENVKQTYALPKALAAFLQVHLLQLDFFVEFAHQIQKCLLVHILGEGVLQGHCFLVLERGIYYIASDFSSLELKALKESIKLQPQECGNICQVLFVDDYCHFLVVFRQLLAKR